MAPDHKPRLTDKQLLAVGCPASPVVVRAGAGSGKTSVLVERYLRLVLEQGKSLARILAATFTEKAAAEMKERVSRRLMAAGRADLAAQLNVAPICTLHSFCSRLITPHALKLGLDPNYRIVEEHEADLLQEEVLGNLLARWRRERADSLQVLATHLHWSADYGLRPGRSPGSRGFSRQFLNLIRSARCSGRRGGEIFRPLEVDAEKIAAEAKDHLAKLEAFLRGARSGRAEKSLEKAEAAKRFLEGYIALSDKRGNPAMEIADALAKISLQVSAELKAILRPIREELCPQIADLCHERDYNAVRSVLNELGEQFIEAYWQRKAEMGALDFLDLEEKALKILRGPDQDPPVDLILIDEAQDLNPVQWEIVRHLRQDAELFAVGDGQQSIYGFRDAEVGLFLDLAREAASGTGEVIPLDENFRSRPELLAVVNRIFEKLFPEEDGVSFLRLEGKYPYPATPDDRVELLLAAAEDRQKARAAEADLLAERLIELVESESFKIHRERGRDPEGRQILIPEKPNWGDVLVLVRASTSFAPLERAFHARAIPFVLQAGRGFWDALEISDLLVLLRSLENPGDDFSLACLLRSPAVGFSDDDLIELRFVPEAAANESSGGRIRSLYEGLLEIASQGGAEDSLARRAEKFLHLFQRLYRLKDRIPLREIIEIWIGETGLEAYWAQEDQGHRMAANVRKFLRLCDAKGGESAGRLRAIFEEMRLRDLQESSAPAATLDGGAVRIMTVHAAKGLEAPIVAIFDMNYRPRGGSGDFVYSREASAAFCLAADDFGGDPHKPRLFKAIVEEKKNRLGDEEARVLYVAMTRAREKLILSASCSQKEDRNIRSGGWFKSLLEHKLLPDLETLLNPSAMPQDQILIPDKAGVMAALDLRRAKAGLEPRIAPASAPQMRPEPEAPPAGFPRPPEVVHMPLSVTELLKQSGAYEEAFAELPEDGDERPLSLGGMNLGALAHRILQVVLQNGGGDRLHEIARAEAMKLFHEEPSADFLSEAAQICSNFLKSDLAQQMQKAKITLSEFPIIFDYNGNLFKAKLDLAFGDDLDWTLVDFKSGAAPSKELMQTYHRQLQIYAIGWRAMTGNLPSRALIFWLNSGEVMEVPLNEAALQAVIKG